MTFLKVTTHVLTNADSALLLIAPDTPGNGDSDALAGEGHDIDPL